MKKIVNLCLILAVGVMATSCNCMKKMAKNVDDVVVTCNPEVLTLKGNNVVTDVTVSFPEKYYNKKAIAKVTPVLEFEGGSIAGTPQYFQGSKVKDNYIVIDKKTGGSYTISVSIPYDPRAEVSTLVMVIEGRCDGDDAEMTEVTRVPVAEGVNTLQNQVDYTSALEMMSDKYEKTTVISEKADIMYTINQSNVRKNQLTTEQIKALEAFITENVDKDRVTLGSVYANGYASPDGPLAMNDKLSKARSESGKKALSKELKKVEGVSYDAAAYGEDWDGFKQLVEASNIEDKAMILQILQMTSNPAERDAQIKNMSAVFEQLAKEVLPQLRRTQLVATAEVQNLTDAEIVAAIENGDLASLSLEQLLYGATLIEDVATKAKVYEAATKFNDARAYNNLGVVNAQMGNWAEAAAAFAKASSLSSDAAINNNLAVGALAEGKVAEAKQYIAGASEEAKALAAVAEGDYAAANGKLTGYNAAVNYVLEGNLSAAKSAIASDKSAKAEYLRATIASMEGNESEAKAYLNSAIEKNPALKAKAEKDVNLKALL